MALGKMLMKIVALIGIVLFLSGLSFAGTSSCIDGTGYFACSKTAGYVGMRCGPNGLARDTTCQCESVAGYITVGVGADSLCELAKCGNIDIGACDPSNKPKMCVSGQLIDNATKCGCPSGKKISANGLACESIPCNDSGMNVLDGQCAVKSSGMKCVNGILVDKASECPCKSGLTKVGEKCLVVCSDGTQDGACSTTKPQECVNGYLLDNAAKCGCPDGKTAVGKQCTDSIFGSIGGTDLLGGSPSGNQTQTEGASTSPMACCCLPTAMIVLAIGFAFSRKNQ